MVADIIECANVGMVQREDSSGFAFKPLLGLRIFGEVRWKNLDCDRAIKPCVERTIHLTHPAGA